MIKKRILERLIALSPMASDDPNRYNISRVRIKSNDQAVTLTATNGHMLITEDHEAGSCPHGEYMFHEDDIPVTKLILKECKHIEEIECSIDQNQNLFLGVSTKVRIAKLDQKYPDYKHVIPAEIKNKVAIAFNASYLYDLMTALAFKKSPFVWIEFDAAHPRSPMLVHGIEKSTAVLMPCRQAEVDAIAIDHLNKIAWIEASQEKAEATS